MFPKNEPNALRFSLILSDIGTAFLCLSLAMFLFFETFAFLNQLKYFYVFALVIVPTIYANARLGLYRYFLREISTNIVFVSIYASLSTVCIFLIIKSFLISFVPWTVPVIYGLLFFPGLLITRVFIIKILFSLKPKNRKKIAVYGAGSAGVRIIDELRFDPNYEVCMVIDDYKKNRYNILGHRVVTFNEAHKQFKNKKIKSVLLAMPSINLSKRKQIISKLSNLSLQVITIPNLSDLISGKLEINNIKNVEIDELLRRKVAEPNPTLLHKNIKGKTILVSGAGGSIGCELCLQIIDQKPTQLIIVDISEFSIYKLLQKIEDKAKKSGVTVLPYIGSIGDSTFISNILSEHKIFGIFHAAAYKHVPLMELNPYQAIKNNTIGTFTFANEAVKHNVSTFTLISTDKAVNPTNIMGASKRLAERICISLNGKQSVTRFTCVRFGNVLGSSGSVVQLFKKQIALGGPITLTHPEIIRYFMSISEAVQLVIQSSSLKKYGEIFVLDMGKQVKIKDLAEDMVKLSGLKVCNENNGDESGDIEIIVTGLRPGEKMYEEISYNGQLTDTIHPRIKTVKENHSHITNLDMFINKLQQVLEIKDIELLKELLSEYAKYSSK